MAILRRCTEYANEIEVRSSDPAIEIWRRALYVPIDDRVSWETGGGWGLFDADGGSIEASNYYRGPGKVILGQSPSTNLPLSAFERAPPGKYLYGGNLIGHYGHFLLSTLSRFWLGHYEDLRQYRIVCHAAGTPSSWFTNPFVKYVFGALGLTADNFVVFKRPTLFPELIIPRPAAEEHNYTHRVFGDLGRTIAQMMLCDFDLPINDKPVWLSKTRVKSGVQGFENEDELVGHLEKEGVEIIHPQEMFPILQIMLFHTRSRIMGGVGSAFHTKLFGAAGRVLCLSYKDKINSNYGLTELISPNPIDFYAVAMLPSQAETKRFSSGYDIVDAKAVSQNLLEILYSDGQN